jgi:hypothetical protein
VKHCHHRFPPDCLQALLSLRIKDVNLDKEKMNELNRYRTLTRKEKLLQLSKRERRVSIFFFSELRGEGQSLGWKREKC